MAVEIAPLHAAEGHTREGALAARGVLETAGVVAGIVGLTALAFGIVLYVMDPGTLPISLANVIVGLSAILFYSLTHWRNIVGVFSGRSSSMVGLESLIVLGAMGVLITINVLGSRVTKEWDLTFDKLHTLSEVSIAFAKNLKTEVRVIGFYQPTDPRRDVLEEAVQKYQRFSKKIALTFVNPDVAPAEAKKYGLTVRGPRIVVVGEASKSTKIQAPIEEALTNAFIEVAEKPKRKAYFLSGHGEPNLDDTESAEAYGVAATALRNDGYEVESMDLVHRQSIPQDADLVIIAGATQPLLAHEIESIRRWSNLGGRVLYLAEPGQNIGLEGTLNELQIQLGKNVVLDPSPAAQAAGYGSDSPVITRFGPHPVTQALKTVAVFLHSAQSLIPEFRDESTSIETLLETGPSSWATQSAASKAGGIPVSEQKPEDTPGPLAVALAVTRAIPSQTLQVSPEARWVLVGDQDFTTNRFFAFSANSDFFENACRWLSGDDDRIRIALRRRGGRRLPLTQAQHWGIVFFSVNLLPLLVIASGLSVWAVRRRR
jgi:ABC-type uncharacterized transport system involved in gliding motility auxiliary subunit